MVGCGARSQMYQDALQRTYRDRAELVGLCDVNAGRLALAQARSIANGAAVPDAAPPDGLEALLGRVNAQVVIVLTRDAVHHDFIIRAMNAGCDVITEKPMTTTAEACLQIAEARRRTGRRCRVTFNYRYSPPRSQVKALLMEGVIGDVLSVDFHWLLNTIHGADYFRRWHSDKANSGGLMVHKATHHFDLINWWLGAVPVAVSGSGSRQFYTPEMARRMGLSGPHERCHTCPEAHLCSFRLDLAAVPSLRDLYLDQEGHDGYFRDRCVWRPEIGIEDTMSVQVKYDTGASLSYSLQAYNAWEGYTIAFNGSRGRLEHTMEEQVYVSGRDEIQGGMEEERVSIRVIPLRGAARDIPVWKAEGSHGGGDPVLLDDLFSGESRPDPYGRVADDRAGAYSAAVGIAANRSFITGATVPISGLIPGIERPDYPPMPTRADPVPMPPPM